ncbi:MAG: hypothetical protein JXB45_03600 [Candidatus Krumholzibacteriota bacterium]|nr:hypothetical protein [Candidatus Krumholzibacteriota bacterium]
MAVYNYAGGEINIKIVYYGPGLSGKTTNLEHIYSKLPRDNKGKMVSMKTRTDRTLFFDFLPIAVGDLHGMKLRFLLYTVPGQVYYNATRKLVLKGVDAVVFVADSSAERMEDNRESLQNLEENLNELGISLREIPWIIQLNKQDLPDHLSREVLDKELNELNVPVYEAVAMKGAGVYETFEGVAGLVFRKLRKEFKEASRKEKESTDNSDQEAINVEVVAQGKSRVQNSEMEESKSVGYAEEREEEHKSVSEFVDSVLTEEKAAEEQIDMGSTRAGFEEYGHVVELGDENQKETAAGAETVTSVATRTQEDEFINDPLEKFSPQAEAEPKAEKDVDSGSREMPLEKEVRVPLTLSQEEIRQKLPVRVVIEISVK